MTQPVTDMYRHTSDPSGPKLPFIHQSRKAATRMFRLWEYLWPKKLGLKSQFIWLILVHFAMQTECTYNVDMPSDRMMSIWNIDPLCENACNLVTKDCNTAYCAYRGLCCFFTAGRRRRLRFCVFCARGQSRRIWEMFNFLRRANKRVSRSHKTSCALTGSNRRADCTSRAAEEWQI